MEQQILTRLQTLARALKVEKYQSSWYERLERCSNTGLVISLSMFPMALFLASMRAWMVPMALLIAAQFVALGGMTIVLVAAMTLFATDFFRIEVHGLWAHEQAVRNAADSLRDEFREHQSWKKIRRTIEDWKQRVSESLGLRLGVAGLALAAYLAQIASRADDTSPADPLAFGWAFWRLGTDMPNWWLGMLCWLFVGCMFGAVLAYLQHQRAVVMADIIRRVDADE